MMSSSPASNGEGKPKEETFHERHSQTPSTPGDSSVTPDEYQSSGNELGGVYGANGGHPGHGSNPELRHEHSSQTPSEHEQSSTATQHPKTPVRPPMGSRRSHKLKGHSRNPSNTKLLLANKAGPGPNQARPHLNRSMSTDGLMKARSTALKRTSPSFTKLTTLQPLTRTTSNPSIKTTLRPLTKTMLNQSIKSNRSNTSLKGLVMSNNNIVPLSGLKTSGKKGKAILKLNDDFKDDDYEDSDTADSEAEGDSEEPRKPEREVIPETFEQPKVPAPPEVFQQPNITALMSDMSLSPAPAHPVVDTDAEVPIGSQIKQQLEKSNPQDKPVRPISSRQSSAEDLDSSNLYGGSLLLSQSTGLTKKIDSKAGQGQVYTGVTLNPLSGPRIPTESSLDSNNSESISGISFKAKRSNNVASDQDQNLAEPVTTNKTVAPPNSYQPNQSIFNNLQRTNSQYLSKKKSQQFHNGTNNFADFLNKSHSSNGHSNVNESSLRHNNVESSSHGTRTQQRLWLQRENSLMDVSHNDAYKTLSSVSLNKMMFGNYNQSSTNLRDYPTPNPIVSNGSSLAVTPGTGPESSSASINSLNGLLMATQSRHQNLLQSRTEFERLNREYLNVRRHLNPVAESLNRVEKAISSNKDLQIPKSSGKRNATYTLSSISMQGENKNANTFKEFSPVYQEKESEIANMLESMWKEALIQYSSVKQQQIQQQIQSVQPITQQSIGRQDPRSSYEYSNSIRSVQPTTRKLAQQAAARQGQQLFIRGD